MSHNFFFRQINRKLSDNEWLDEAKTVLSLAKSIPGVQVDATRFYRSGYNRPTDTTNIRNEVWWIKDATDYRVTSLNGPN